MYEHGEKSIDEDSLMSVITTGEFYISLMLQMGFLEHMKVIRCSTINFSLIHLQIF